MSALRGVTVDIYENARDQTIIDDSVCFPILPRFPSSPPHSSSILQSSLFTLHTSLTIKLHHHQSQAFHNLSTSLTGSATRLGRMAQAGNKIAVLKLAGIIIVAVILLYWIFGLLFGR